MKEKFQEAIDKLDKGDLGRIVLPQYNSKEQTVYFDFINPLTGKKLSKIYFKNVKKEPKFVKYFYYKNRFYALVKVNDSFYSIVDNKAVRLTSIVDFDEDVHEPKQYLDLPYFWVRDKKDMQVLMDYNGRTIFKVPDAYFVHTVLGGGNNNIDGRPIYSGFAVGKNKNSNSENILVDPFNNKIERTGLSSSYASESGQNNILFVFGKDMKKDRFILRAYKHGISQKNIVSEVIIDDAFLKKHKAGITIAEMENKYSISKNDISFHLLPDGLIAIKSRVDEPTEKGNILLFSYDYLNNTLNYVYSINSQKWKAEDVRIVDKYYTPVYNDNNIISLVVDSSLNSILVFKKNKNGIFKLVNELNSIYSDSDSYMVASDNKNLYYRYKSNIIAIDKNDPEKVLMLKGRLDTSLYNGMGTYKTKYNKKQNTLYRFFSDQKKLYKDKVYFDKVKYISDDLMVGINEEGLLKLNPLTNKMKHKSSIYFIRLNNPELQVAYKAQGIDADVYSLHFDNKKYYLSFINNTSTSSKDFNEKTKKPFKWILMDKDGKVLYKVNVSLKGTYRDIDKAQQQLVNLFENIDMFIRQVKTNNIDKELER